MMELFNELLTYFLILLLAVYVRQIFFFYRGLSRLSAGSNRCLHTMTVIIPARNEEQNIGNCLRSLMEQDYPKEKLSIIVIDDQSTDRTSDIVRTLTLQSPFPVTLLRSDITSSIRSPKIRAMSLGIQHSLSDIIVTTDADCTVSPLWVATINTYFDENVGIVTGLTVYESRRERSAIFYGIQFLDFISYTSIAAGAIGMGRVLVSNGSNMAFRIQAFDESGGFDTLAHINTGDDSLLAQKIVADRRWKARFAYDDHAVVRTQPAATWKEVLHQRMRWVGQTSYYPPYMMFFMICTFIMFILLTVWLPLSFFHWSIVPWLILAGKFSTDYFFMRKFTTLTHTTNAMRYFFQTAVIHIPFILLSTFGGYFFSFDWKDRTLTKESQ
ncbi:MAG: glycosyltransferase [Bacteroidetes bacterium]|nr:glycosyltransferase [Bacteroidota bacterium]